MPSNQLNLSPEARSAIITGFATGLERGQETVKVQIYSAGSGIPIDEAEPIDDQVLLAVHESSKGSNAFKDTVSNGSLTANAFDDVLAAESGMPAFFRLIDSKKLVYMQGTCGTNGTHMIVNTINYIKGGNSSITNFSVTIPAAVA